MTKRYKELHSKISIWYKKYGRHDLPWRKTKKAYEVYISEIMLQQTQVKTVLEKYYFPFLKRFPTLASIAHASEDEVLKLWEGLGYYSRARNIYKTAQLQKTLPNSFDELVSLPGIGKSTAHAILCFGFQKPYAILDANVKRILYRFFAQKKCSENELWELSFQLFDENNAYNYNQALMDIGSSICLPKNPLCQDCPLQSLCKGQNSPLEYPQKKAKKAKPIRKKVILIEKFENHYCIAQNHDQKLLKGLFGFYQVEDESFEIEEKNHKKIGFVEHQYSHFKLEAIVYVMDIEYLKESMYTLEEIENLALSSADKKILKLLY